MREIIVIQLGNRGANIGSSFWQQISPEHGIENLVVQQLGSDHKGSYYHSIFHEVSENKVVPRSVVVDLEPDNFENADTPFMQYPDYINAEENIIRLNNRSPGKLRSEESSQIESAMRKQMERCDSHAHCIFIRDTTEVTSTILSDYKLDILARKNVHDFSIVADRTSTDEQIVNSILSRELFEEYYPNRIIYQDSAIQRQVHSKNQQTKIDLNRFVAKTMSSLTEVDRFDDYHGISLSDITHMDPYPSIGFGVPSFVTTFDGVSMPCETDQSPQSLVENSMHNSSLLCDVDFSGGKYLRVHLFARGLQATEIQSNVQRLKQNEKVKFVSWAPTGFKLGLTNNTPPIKSALFPYEERSVCTVSLNSSVRTIFQLWHEKITRSKTNDSLTRLLERNNIEEDVFNEAFNELGTRIVDFTEIEMDPEDDDL